MRPEPGETRPEPDPGKLEHQCCQDVRKELGRLKDEMTKISRMVAMLLADKKETRPAEAARTSYASIAAKGGLIAAKAASGIIRPPAKGTRTSVSARSALEVKVVVNDPAAARVLRTRTARQIVEGINKSMENEGGFGRATAARLFDSGEVKISTDDIMDRKDLITRTGWLGTLAPKAVIVQQKYQVLVHGIRTGAIDTKDQDKLNEEIRAENSGWMKKGDILKATWIGKNATQKPHSSLILSFSTAKTANRVIDKGLLYEYNVRDAEVWDNSCRRRQCYRCNRYGHFASDCRLPQTCAHCAGPHMVTECPTKSSRATARCVTCRVDGHGAWERICPQGIRENNRVRRAMDQRLGRFDESHEPEDLESKYLECRKWKSNKGAPRAASAELKSPATGNKTAAEKGEREGPVKIFSGTPGVPGLSGMVETRHFLPNKSTKAGRISVPSAKAKANSVTISKARVSSAANGKPRASVEVDEEENERARKKRTRGGSRRRLPPWTTSRGSRASRSGIWTSTL